MIFYKISLALSLKKQISAYKTYYRRSIAMKCIDNPKPYMLAYIFDSAQMESISYGDEILKLIDEELDAL